VTEGVSESEVMLYTHILTHIYDSTLLYTHTYTHTLKQLYTHIGEIMQEGKDITVVGWGAQLQVLQQVCVCMYVVCMYVCVCVCVCVRMFFVCMNGYTHILTHTLVH